MFSVKCKHCRKVLFDYENASLIDSHGNEKNDTTKQTGCNQNADLESCLYISEEKIPDWIMKIIQHESWIKGRLNCPHCNNRVGSFNFINETKCECNKFTLPPIRIIYSKVDPL